MAEIQREFINSEMFKKLAYRASSMSKIIEHLEGSLKDGPNTIIETGTAWFEGEWRGQGQSTLIWDWFKDRVPNKDLRILSLELRQEAIDTASKQTKHVEYLLGDSIKSLSLLPRELIATTRFLYLDSFDWSPELHIASSMHHLAELAAVWSHLPSGCMIAVDDRHSTSEGKHVMVQYFMKSLGLKPVFCDYQIGWIKP